MITSAENLKGSTIAPVIIPRVGHQPVRSSILFTPSQEANSVTSKRFALNVLVHSSLVVGEVLVDREGSFGGAVGHQLDLDLLDVALEGVALLAVGLILFIGHIVAWVVTTTMAFGGL